MLKLERLTATRIVATPTALDAITGMEDTLILRLAPDEALILPPVNDMRLSDPHAIIVAEGGFAGAWVATEAALNLLEHTCEWALPGHRPAFAQGAVAGIPVKLWLAEERVLFIVPVPYLYDFEERANA